MSQLSRGMGFVALVTILSVGAAQSQERKVNSTAVNADALVLQDFQQRVGKYVHLHNQAAKKSPPFKQTTDTAKIKAAQQVLADTIQSARKGAQPGDIFTPEIRRKFKQLMYPELKGPDGRETRTLIKEDAPTAVPLKVKVNSQEVPPLLTVLQT